MFKFFVSLSILLLLAGCSTPQTRARSNPDLMATLSPDERAQVEAGEIDLGFTEEMVQIALGDTDRRYVERTAEGETVIWAYHASRGLSGVSVGVGVGTGIGRTRGTAVGGGVSVGTGGRLRPEERMRVVFHEGQVVGIERADR